MNSPEQMFGQNYGANNEKEKTEDTQKFVVVDRTTGLAETYNTAAEAAEAKERMQDPEYSK